MRERETKTPNQNLLAPVANNGGRRRMVVMHTQLGFNSHDMDRNKIDGISLSLHLVQETIQKNQGQKATVNEGGRKIESSFSSLALLSPTAVIGSQRRGSERTERAGMGKALFFRKSSFWQGMY